MTQPPAADAPTCPRHPDRVSYVRCQRCERPTCPECQRPAAVGVLCVDCLQQAQAAARPVRSRLGFTMSSGPPIVTYVLIGLNVAVFLIGTFFVGAGWTNYLALFPEITPEQAAFYVDAGDEWWRWVTAGFTHFGWVHIAMNMFALWNLGQVLEPALGRWRYLGMYAGSLLGSSLVVQLLGTGGELVSVAGASGAIFGLVAAYGVVLRKLNLPYTGVLVIAGIFIVGPLVAEFIPGLAFFSGLSWQGHLGGALVGAALMFLMLRGVDRRVSST